MTETAELRMKPGKYISFSVVCTLNYVVYQGQNTIYFDVINNEDNFF